MVGKILSATFGAFLLVLSICVPVLACEPRDHGAEINLEYSEVVFLGRVLSRTEEQRALGEGHVCTVFKYQFKVTKAWKGVAGQDISVNGVSSCERPVAPPPFLDCEPLDWGEFKVGQTYLVYANYSVYENDASLYAWLGDAGASKLFTEATRDIRDLSAITPTFIQPGMPKAGMADITGLNIALLGCAVCVAGLVLRVYAYCSKA